MEGEHTLGPVHQDAGSHDPRPSLQVIHIPEADQEAQALRGDTGRPLSPGGDGVDGSANEWLDVDPGTTWEDYGPRAPVPKGYVLNEGADYIPFDIRLPSGCHRRVGTLIFILSYLKARDPERILPYVDRGTFVF